MAQNFRQLRERLPPAAALRLGDLEVWSRQRHGQFAGLLAERLREGWVRECHGDLHLGNIALVGDRLQIFDCIEFNPSLRWIDVLSEIAFLTMDLEERGRADYGHRLLNRYLEGTGDYGGLPLLVFYQVYRALVRAKVAAIRAAQEESGTADLATCDQYLAYAARIATRGEPRLLLLHGLAGSGKTWLAQGLLERLGAICLRSDIVRKRLHGVAPLAASGSTLDGGIYSSAATAATYSRLVELGRHILAAGYPALVDAACLKTWQRDAFRNLAKELRVPFAILACTAPDAVLRARIAKREAAGRDASEADQAVLDHQMGIREPLTPEEEACSLAIDTSASFPEDLPQRLCRIRVPGIP